MRAMALWESSRWLEVLVVLMAGTRLALESLRVWIAFNARGGAEWAVKSWAEHERRLGWLPWESA